MLNEVMVLKGIWLAIIVLAGVVASAAALPAWAIGAGAPSALKAAGAAFVGWVTIALASMMIFLT